MKPKLCPECGQEMLEQIEFPGLWLCVDYLEPLNDRAPFKYKCLGMRLTRAGAREFTAAMDLEIAKRN